MPRTLYGVTAGRCGRHHKGNTIVIPDKLTPEEACLLIARQGYGHAITKDSMITIARRALKTIGKSWQG